MKRTFLTLLVALGLMAAFVVPVTGAQVIKFTICHATSSEEHPFSKIAVPEGSSLFPHLSDNEGNSPLAGHEQDLLFVGDVDCPGGVEPTPTPTPVPTPSPEPTPSPVPTPSPSPSPSPEPSPSPTADLFAAEPDVCRFEGDESRIVIRRLAGLLILANLDLYVDGDLITKEDFEFNADGTEARLVVAPGVHTWAVVNPDTQDTLAEGEVDCPDCFGAAPEPSPTPTKRDELPPTDTLSVNEGTGTLLPILLVVIVGVSASYLTLRRKT